MVVAILIGLFVLQSDRPAREKAERRGRVAVGEPAYDSVA